MPVPSTPQDLITLIREKLYDNTSGIIEEDTLRNVLENIIKVLDAKFSFFSPTLTEEQYSQWNLMLDYMLRETKGVLTISSTAPTGTTAKGKYLLSDVGTYTNLGGIVTTAGKLNYAYFDGTTWSLVSISPPENIYIKKFKDLSFPVSYPITVSCENEIYSLKEGKTANNTDIPNISDKWEKQAKQLYEEQEIQNEYYDLAESVGGNTNETFYANFNSKFNYQSKLKGIRIKTNGNTTAYIKAFNIKDSDNSFTELHSFSDISVTSGDNIYTINDEFLVPKGAYIGVKFSTPNVLFYSVNDYEKSYFPGNKSVANLAYKPIVDGFDIFSSISEDKANNSFISKILNTWDETKFHNGYIGTNGQVANNTDVNWRYSDFIEFEQNKKVDYKIFGHSIINSISFYDDNKQYISGIANTQVGLMQGSVTSPVNTKFIRLSGGSSTFEPAQLLIPFFANIEVDFQGNLNRITNEINSIKSNLPTNRKQVKLNLSGGKVILYGDSISSTDYPWYKSAMETLTGANVYNGGFSGYSTSQLAHNTQLQRIFDFEPKLIVALVGGNDTGESGTVGSFIGLNNEPIVSETDINSDYNGTYFIQAVSHIIRKVKKHYYNIRERANLTGTETEEEKTAKIDAVLKPYFAFCTTLPQKRIDATHPFSNSENWKRKRDAIIECCQKYNVHCIDLFSMLEWDMSLEPYWQSPTNMTVNNGIFTMDGLHPNKYGYEQISKIVCGEIGI